MVHLLIEPELRYWFCERFNGSALGVHGIYSSYNVGGYYVPALMEPLFDNKFRYQGSAFGGGLSYNYHWMLGKRFGIEFSLGAGVVYLQYTKYDCKFCSDPIGPFKKFYYGPTKMGINLIFIIN